MSDRDREPLVPAYLRGVLTVEAELPVGSIGPDGRMHTGSISPVLVALSYADGTASLVIEDADGQLTRPRIPGWAFLRLIDGAERMLAASPTSAPGPRTAGATDPASGRPAPAPDQVSLTMSLGSSANRRAGTDGFSRAYRYARSWVFPGA